MSASRQSFSSQGCWAMMNSISSLRTAFTKLKPSFQQVTMQGASVQMAWMREQPSTGKTCSSHCSEAGPQKE